MKKLIVLVLSIIVLAGCSPKPEQLRPLVEQTVAAIPTQTAYPTYTPNPTLTPYPTYTKVPAATKTPKPTSTPTQALISDPTGIAVAKNHLGVFESKGVSIEILRVVLSDKSWSDLVSISNISDWKMANTYIMIEFKVTNNSEKKANLMLRQGSMVAIAGEQVGGSDYLWDMDYFGDDPDSDIMPGVTLQGGFWLPLDTPFDEIQTVYLDFVGAFIDGNGIFRNIELKLDISNWTFESRPEE